MAERTRGHRRREVGTVVSDKRDKTITVAVKRLVRHPKYGKHVFRSARRVAHDEKNEARAGDRVEIMQSRPLSRQKRWVLMSVVGRAAE